MPYGDERNEKSDRKSLFLKQIINYSFKNFQNYFSNFGKLFINITSQKDFSLYHFGRKLNKEI